jgi:hypothetical protein
MLRDTRVINPASSSIMDCRSSGFDDPFNRSIEQNDCFRSQLNIPQCIRKSTIEDDAFTPVKIIKSRNNESLVEKLNFKSTANLSHVLLSRHGAGIKHFLEPISQMNNRTMNLLPSFNKQSAMQIPNRDPDMMLSNQQSRARKHKVPSLVLNFNNNEE